MTRAGEHHPAKVILIHSATREPEKKRRWSPIILRVCPVTVNVAVDRIQLSSGRFAAPEVANRYQVVHRDDEVANHCNYRQEEAEHDHYDVSGQLCQNGSDLPVRGNAISQTTARQSKAD